MTEIDRPPGGAQAYFEAIEETFVRLRGAPLLLSPTDWQVSKEWFEAGIPLDLVVQVLETVFARRKERASKGRVQSLRYCSEAVLKAWTEVRELEAGGRRRPAVAIDVGARLGALASRLPADLPNREGWARRICELRGSPDEVERDLAELDSQLLQASTETLDEVGRQRLADRVEQILEGLKGRLPEAEIEAARERIERGSVRELARLPLLSLFSSEALAPSGDSEALPS
jgi:hypothetical protein